MTRQDENTDKSGRPTLAVAIAVAVIVAVLATSGLTWMFVSNQLGYPFFWERPGSVTGEQWQTHIRNAATLLGVPGIAAALVFSYFRQRTNDRTQGTTSAVLELQQEQHQFETVSRFRDRYTAAAEQLGHQSEAVQLAGVYALAGLADDWGELRRYRDRQDCIDMIISTLESAQEARDGNSLTHIEARIRRLFDQHFQSELAAGRSWHDVDVNLSEYNRAWGAARDWKFDGGNKVFDAATFAIGVSAVLQSVHITGTSTLHILTSGHGLKLQNLDVRDSAMLRIESSTPEGTTQVNPHFITCVLDGGYVVFSERMEPAPKRVVRFEECVFSGTSLRLPVRPERYELIFADCSFAENPFDRTVSADEKPTVRFEGKTTFMGRMSEFDLETRTIFDREWVTE